MERQRLGFAQSEFSVLVGMSKTTQFNYESGERMPDALYLHHAHSHGMDIQFVVTGKRSAGGEDAFVVVPLLAVQTPVNAYAVAEQQGNYSVDGLCFSREWLQRRSLNASDLAVITVRGTSMDGVLSNGDQVLLDKQDTSPRSGFVYVLRQGAEYLVKYCQLLPGGLLRVSSANQLYAPYDVNLNESTDVQIVGRVVASVHEW